jgi:hypothetical protein
VTAALLGRSVVGETRDDYLTAYADVTSQQLIDHAYAATTVEELDRCELVALLVIGLPTIARDQFTALNGQRFTVEDHLSFARARMGAGRCDPTPGQTAAMEAELAERRTAGKQLGKDRRTERAERLRAAAQSP